MPNTPLGTHAFTYIVVTYDGVQLRAYVNGVQDAKAVVGDARVMNNFSVHAFIGSTGGSNYFGGVIDEVAVYDRALTVDRIDGAATYSSPGRPIAVIGNVMIEYRPAPPKPLKKTGRGRQGAINGDLRCEFYSACC